MFQLCVHLCSIVQVRELHVQHVDMLYGMRGLAKANYSHLGLVSECVLLAREYNLNTMSYVDAVVFHARLDSYWLCINGQMFIYRARYAELVFNTCVL